MTEDDMAEKHLGEAGWKALAVRQKLKDEGLAKALAAYEKLGDKGAPDARLAALDDVEKIAAKLRKDKAVAAVKDAAAWLDETLKEAAKTRQTLAALQKSAQSKNSPQSEQSEEESGDLAARLAAGLNRVRNGRGEISLPFIACVANPVYGLMVAKRIAPQHKVELSEATGGRKFLLGTCVFESGKLTFVMETVKSGLAKHLQKAIKEVTGKKLPVRARDAASTSVLDDETDVEETEVPTAPPPPPMKGAPGPTIDQLKARLDKVVDGVKKTAAAKAPGAVAALKEATLAAGECGALLKKGDAAGAAKALEKATAALAKAISASGGGKSEDRTKWNKARDAWRSASDDVDAQIAALQTALRRESDEELDSIAEYGLNAVTGGFKVPLMASIRELDGAQGDAFEKAASKALGVIDGFKKHLASDERVAACDDNPFGVPVSIRSTLTPALDAMQSALA
jgi:hypothetical protein